VEEQGLKWWHVRWGAAGRAISRLAIIVALIVAAVYTVALTVALSDLALFEPGLLFFALVLSFFTLVRFKVGKVMDKEAKKGKKSLRASLVISAVIAVVLYVGDAFVFYEELFGWVVLLYSLIATLWALLADRRVAVMITADARWTNSELLKRVPRLGLRAAEMSIYLLAVVSISVTNDLQNKMADRRTVKLGDACLAYRAKYHHYPGNLEAVVPEFISSVPVARYGLPGDTFQYHYIHNDTFDDGPKLSYDRRRWRKYNIESHTWVEIGRLSGFN
jgi:hypothetical protein